MLSDLLTTKQVADRLGRTVRQVHGLVERGELTPADRLPPPRGALFFHPAEVDRYIAVAAAEAAS